jgi:hypothetical protein
MVAHYLPNSLYLLRRCLTHLNYNPTAALAQMAALADCIRALCQRRLGAGRHSRINKVMTQLTSREKYDMALVQRVLRCAFPMSEENLGAAFLV